MVACTVDEVDAVTAANEFEVKVTRNHATRERHLILQRDRKSRLEFGRFRTELLQDSPSEQFNVQFNGSLRLSVP